MTKREQYDLKFVKKMHTGSYFYFVKPIDQNQTSQVRTLAFTLNGFFRSIAAEVLNEINFAQSYPNYVSDFWELESVGGGRNKNCTTNIFLWQRKFSNAFTGF